MCRMFGIVSNSPRTAVEQLSQAPRSLRALSKDHPDGWGVAIRTDAWQIERGVECAAACERFEHVARTETRLIIAHIRKATVGKTSISNTHPFRRDNFVFAHNGTVTAVPALRARTASVHLDRIEGDTDSERLFAFVLTQIDTEGDVARGVAAAVRVLHLLGDIGSASFLLSCGAKIYAHRLGRTLFVAHRDGASMIASEPLDETWTELPERAVIVLDAHEQVITTLAA